MLSRGKTSHFRLRGANKGFTLIELLVVMAVLSILIGIGVNTFTIAQKKARDTKRKADLATLTKAMVVYKINNNATPATPGGGSWAFVSSLSTALQPYLPSIPNDPLNTGCSGNPSNVFNSTTCYAYIYRKACNEGYEFATRFEDPQDPQAGKTITCPDGSGVDGPNAGVYFIKAE